MSNDININNPSGLRGTAQRGVQHPTQGTERRDTPAPLPTPVTDRVSVTSEAARLQEIEEHLLSVPEVNAQKVAEIKAAIASGTFEINPQRIAEKLIAFESGGRGK
jgi:negative regulator of flagellin synthesis FlgM